MLISHVMIETKLLFFSSFVWELEEQFPILSRSILFRDGDILYCSQFCSMADAVDTLSPCGSVVQAFSLWWFTRRCSFCFPLTGLR